VLMITVEKGAGVSEPITSFLPPSTFATTRMDLCTYLRAP
jgi:hypothetical protein